MIHLKKLRFVFLITLLLASHLSWAIAVGDGVKVEWHGKWWPASVLKVDGDKYYIHYTGYASSWDEWVGPSRIRGGSVAESAAAKSGIEVGESVKVEWKGKWWPATVKVVGDNKWFIHYDGYESSWDEWVGPSRIRK